MTKEADALRDAPRLVGFLDITEGHRRLRGTGTIDWASLLRAFVSSGYWGSADLRVVLL